ncbi:MAG: hypothetical protein LBD60_04410 [Puniceicoccales bacterium]|jgi:hypothetical protein|nr:hypothetical protein [Puniceicoccales bacterium]
MKKWITITGLWAKVSLLCFMGITFNSEGLEATAATTVVTPAPVPAPAPVKKTGELPVWFAEVLRNRAISLEDLGKSKEGKKILKEIRKTSLKDLVVGAWKNGCAVDQVVRAKKELAKKELQSFSVSVRSAIEQICFEKFGYKLNKKGSVKKPNVWNKTDTQLQTGGYLEVISYVIEKIISLSKENAVTDFDVKQFQFLLRELAQEYESEGLAPRGGNAHDKPRRSSMEIIKDLAQASKSVPAAKPATLHLDSYNIIFLAAAHLGRTLYNAKAKPFKEIWEQLSNNPFKVELEESALIWGTTKTEKGLTDIAKTFHDMDSGKMYIKGVPQNVLKNLGLCPTGGNDTLRNNRTNFEKQFFFLAMNLLPLLASSPKKSLPPEQVKELEQTENVIFLAIGALRLIEAAERGKEEFEVQVRNLCFALLRFQWSKVFFNGPDGKLKNVTPEYAENFQAKVQQEAERHCLVINKEFLNKFIIIPMVKQGVATFLVEYTKKEPLQKIKDLLQDISIRKQNSCRLFEIGRLLMLLQDNKINDGQRSRDNWEASAREIANLCFLCHNEYSHGKLQPVAYYMSFFLLEFVGYEGFFIGRDFHRNGFPPKSGLEYVNDSLYLHLIHINQYKEQSEKSELEQLIAEATIRFKQEKSMPRDPVNPVLVKEHFCKDIYDGKDVYDSINVENIMLILIRLVDRLAGANLSIAEVLQTTNYLKLLDDLRNYVYFFSNTLSLINLDLKQSQTNLNEILDSLGPKRDSHPFELTLCEAREILKETRSLLIGIKNSLTAGTADQKTKDRWTLEDIQEEIFRIEHDLIQQDNIKTYWDFLKENVELLHGFVLKRSELDEEIKKSSPENVLGKLRNEIRQYIGKFIDVIEQSCESFMETFKKNDKAIRNMQIDYLVSRKSPGIGLEALRKKLEPLNYLGTKVITDLQDLYEKGMTKIEETKQDKKLSLEQKKKQIERHLNEMENGIRKMGPGVIDAVGNNSFDGRSNFFDQIGGNILREQNQQAVKTIFESLPFKKERQAIAPSSHPPYPKTEDAVLRIIIPLRSDYNDRM